MTNTQEDKKSMFEALLEVSQSFSSAVSSIAAFQTGINDLKNVVDEVELNHGKQRSDTTGATVVKGNARQNRIKPRQIQVGIYDGNLLEQGREDVSARV